MFWNRTLSTLVFSAYIIRVIAIGDGGLFFMLVVGLVIPMACIWFPEAMGDYASPSGVYRIINQPTPAPVVCFIGWVMLLLPAVVYVLLEWESYAPYFQRWLPR